MGATPKRLPRGRPWKRRRPRTRRRPRRRSQARRLAPPRARPPGTAASPWASTSGWRLPLRRSVWRTAHRRPRGYRPQSKTGSRRRRRKRRQRKLASRTQTTRRMRMSRRRWAAAPMAPWLSALQRLSKPQRSMQVTAKPQAPDGQRTRRQHVRRRQRHRRRRGCHSRRTSKHPPSWIRSLRGWTPFSTARQRHRQAQSWKRCRSR
mmetsp:Transcript_36366/g.107346  ORF Transcript_36366/g.107346 Transcript_36366/m.107346 type:complete len:206 (-) Transcript_36366:513-1130(-)